jgi:hypothetical protein
MKLSQGGGRQGDEKLNGNNGSKLNYRKTGTRNPKPVNFRWQFQIQSSYKYST